MKKILLLFSFSLASLFSYSQILGNLQSVYPNSAAQGQTLTTTITEVPGSFMMSSPPCSNHEVLLVLGTDSIFSNSYNIPWIDEVDAEFTIPPAATPGFYDVYVGGSYYDWWSGTCITTGYWVLYGGFEITGTTNIGPDKVSAVTVNISPNPFVEKASLSFSNAGHKKYRLSVMDSFGRKVYTEVIDQQEAELSRNNFEAGIYFYKLEGLENKISVTGKFIVLE